jgi:hypothetical protein
MCCLFVQILATVMMTEKPDKSHFLLKTHFVTHFNKKKYLTNSLKTSINQFINLKNPKSDLKTLNQIELDFFSLTSIYFLR